ncbi:MAG: hypothetical protein A3G91_06475 [Omnitrophica WOR_2 bacterium RIFCSPLOWO2_12_FULL_50_9]|nr:MAG: hypothetical protein A3D87_05730 [Omnitrophica WOR_2 bacterium RIFCSPHIGHO2_02_FULL_50_17]OGX40972.1 MAG: hypothetical protein A3G91_06475 [Omnitrophica WOR_2 bacterium RIFCSPLOWO2_12_FULL_50_9]
MTSRQDIQTYQAKMEELKRRVVMKEKVIEAAGRTWSYLRENGETNLTILPRRLKERSEIVNQAIGWLAREDKLRYAQKAGKTFVSLTE